ncbi:MAG: pentapeptide repeat-containing protein [Candidatus Competibacteraceae bacterium]
MPTAHITTFYSFKGGVGRTLLLANVGAALAKLGRKVLLWDLDVEAPGMQHIPALKPRSLPKAGFLEWLADWQYKHQMKIPPPTLNALAKRVRPAPDIRGLEILPAFGEKADFAGLYQSINWSAFLVDQPEIGLRLFCRLLEFLTEKNSYDHILLDARTGITDLGGLMAAVLPNVTVLVGGYGAQNMAGLRSIYQALQPAVDNKLPVRQEPLRRLLVVSPVPIDQEVLLNQRRQIWDQEFAVEPTEIRLDIPFDGRLLFREDLLVLKEPDSAIARAYRSVAETLEDLRQEKQQRQQQAEIAESAYPDKQNRADARQIKGRRFEERIAQLLTLLGYRVEREQYLDNANKVDLIARDDSRLRADCFLVECKDWREPVPKSELERFRTWLNGPQAVNMHATGMFVANSFTREARSYAGTQGIEAYTPADLERKLFNFGPYLDRLRRTFEESPLARTYVKQRLLLESDLEQREGVDLLEHAQRWTQGNGRRLWLVLGDYGTGKSAFFRRFSYELARLVKDNPNAVVPIVIDLKEFPSAVSLEALLQEHFRKYANWHGNPEVFLYLLAAGRAVLLLDAFDEMGTAATVRSVADQFRQLARPAAQAGEDRSANRVLITCRTHFFRDQQQVKDTAVGHSDDLISRDSPLGELARSFEADIDELLLFDKAQIAEFLQKHLGETRAAEALAFIERTYDLPSLAPRPVLLEMIIQTLPDLMRAGGNVTPAGLYLKYTNQWLEDRSGGNLLTTSEQRRQLLESLARELWGLPQHRIHYRQLSDLLEQAPAEQLKGLDPQRVDLELRSAAFLTRTEDGYYSFSHKRFREFFLARHLLRAVRKGSGVFAKAIDSVPVTPEVADFLTDLLEGDDADRLAAATKGILAVAYQPRISENALRLAYRISRHVAERDARKNQTALLMDDLFQRTACYIPEKAHLEGAKLREMPLLEAWLPGAILRGADLRGSDLSSACLENANLSEAQLDGAVLEKTDLRQANLENACLREIQGSQAWLQKAKLNGADLTAAVLVDSNCQNASFISACCHAARFAHAYLEGTNWSEADLTRFTAPGAKTDADLPGLSPNQPFQPLLHLNSWASINTAVFSGDNCFVLTASDDHSARLWDTKTGTQLRRFQGHKNQVLSATFSIDLRFVLS